MNRFFLIGLIKLKLALCFFCLLPTATYGQSPPSIATYKIKYKNNPSNVNLFNLANAYFLNQKYKPALKGYSLVIKRKSTLKAPAMFYSSLCFERLNQPEKAIKLLKRLKVRYLKPSLRFKVETKLAKLLGEPEPKRSKETPYQSRPTFSLYTQFGLAANSNPNLDSDEEIDLDEAIDNSASETDLEYFFLLNPKISLWDQRHFDSLMDLEFYYSNFNENDDLKTMSGTLNFKNSFYFGPNRLSLSPTYSMDQDDTGPINSVFGANLSYTRKFDNLSILVGASHAKSQPESENFTFLDGDITKTHLTISATKEKYSFSGTGQFLNYNYIDSDENPSYRGSLISLYIGYQLNDSVEFSSQISFMNKSYREITVNFDDGITTSSSLETREDKVTSISLASKFYIGDSTDIALSIYRSQNNSNFDNVFTDVGDKSYNFVELRTSLGYYF